MNPCDRFRWAPLAWASVALAAPHASATILESTTIQRAEEFVEVEGVSLPEINGTNLESFALFTWRDGAFEPLNYQVDERGPKGGYFGEDDDPGNLDDNDQIVFMIEDMGDQVDGSHWVDDPGADRDFRYEVEVEDPLNPGEKGWVYIFTGSELSRSTADYVSILAEDPFVIDSDGYFETYAEGIPATMEELKIQPLLGGSGVNLYDRGKFRLKLGLLFSWQTEDDGTFTDRFMKDGPVRVIHGLKVGLPLVEFDISATTVLYYRKMLVVKNTISQLFPPEAKQMVWFGDYEPGVSGLLYYDNRGPDPEADYTFFDEVDGDGKRLIAESAYFKEIVSPVHGGTVSVQDNSDVPAESVESYYCDGCDEDTFPDTGDGQQWGQNGTWMKKVPFTTDPIHVETWTTRLSPSSDSRGGLYARRYRHRVTHSVAWQPALSVGGDSPGTPGRGLTLAQNSPNPFNPHTTIRFAVEEEETSVDLAVFDSAGRRVCTLHRGIATRGDYSYTWNGRDDRGAELPSGAYSYRLVSDGDQWTRSMVLLK